MCQFFPSKAENNSEDAEAKVVSQGQKQDLGKGLLSTKKPANIIEDAEAQVVAKGQK